MLCSPLDGVAQHTDAVGIKLIQNGGGGFRVAMQAENKEVLLAFSNQSSFAPDNLPAHIRSWMDGYEDMSKAFRLNPTEVDAWLAASRLGRQNVEPILKGRMWGQDDPYNLYCPAIGAENCPSGCVATALAQVMSHHKWPQHGEGSISYRTSTRRIWVNCDFGSTYFAWDMMDNSYSPMAHGLDLSSTAERSKRFSFSKMAIDDENSVAKCYIRIGSLSIMGASSFTGETVMLLTDLSDNLVACLSDIVEVGGKNSSLLLSARSFLISVPNELADGEYRIYNAVREKGDTKWLLSFQRSGSQGGESNDYLSIIKEGESFLVNDRFFPCSPTEQSANAIATLMQAVGAAVEMDYNIGGSGSNDRNALNGLVSYLKYDSDMFFANPSVVSDRQWHELLQGELEAGRPVYYTGQGNTAGHAFVIDGMMAADDGTTYYHVNWGWDGLCNGYYLLNMLRPSSAGTGGSSGSNYSNSPSMLIGMMPEDGVSSVRLACRNLAVKDQEVLAGQMVSLRIEKLSPLSGTDYKGSFTVVLRNALEPDAAPVPIYREDLKTISASRGLSNFHLRCKIAGDTPAGVYEVAIECVDENGTAVEVLTDQWPQLTVRDASEWGGGSQTTSEQQIAVRGVVLSEAEDRTLVTLKADSVLNIQKDGAQGQVTLLVCDTTGCLVSVMQTPRLLILAGSGLRKNVTVTGRFSKYLPDGDYQLAIGYLPEGSLRWTLASLLDYEGNIWWSSFPTWFMPMQVEDGKAYIAGCAYEGIDMPLVIGEVRLPSRKTGREYDLSGRETNGGRTQHITIKNKRKTWRK